MKSLQWMSVSTAGMLLKSAAAAAAVAVAVVVASDDV